MGPMDSICQRFIQAEQDFLLVTQADDQLLADFAERWQTLQIDWESCRQEADLGTRQLVDGIASKIEELARDFYVFESRTLSLEGDLLDSLEEVFSSLTLEDPIDAGATSVFNGLAKTVELTPPAHDVISPSQWLLRNLHNPYPLPHIRFSNSRTASSKDMRDWFAKARQRVGWARLLRDRFAGCRSLAIDAAFRAFVRDDPTSPLDVDLKTAFFAIKSHAELVYGDEGATSSKRLRSISPTPSLTFSSSSEDSDDEQCLPPSPENILKRPSKELYPDSPSRKRRRTHEFVESLELQTHAIISAHAGLPPLRPKKRRLSESDSDSPRPKRPRGIEGSRPHAASDPLTVCTLPTWFDLDQSFQIPNPASIDPLDSSSLDLDFFNPASLPLYTTSSTLVPSADIAVTAGDFSALFEIPQLDLLQPGLPTFDSDWTEFLNCEPDFSLFPYSPSFASSLASTPPLVDDAILSPSSPSDNDLCSPDPLLGILPHLDEKDIQFPIGSPVIHGQDFFLPPGEDAGITYASALLSVH